ncbi:MAG: hypothetical protein P8M70_01540 [Verrucomicrobiota bacterium]|nr:hypothetical protein [Verrucomicrobiota bacterium]
MSQDPRILFCHCNYARVVPDEVKNSVLEGLCASGQAFEAVADLCEMAARRDPSLKRLATGETPVKIAACYPRAVKWIFGGCQAPLNTEKTEVINMRELTAEDAATSVLSKTLTPNLPADGSIAEVEGEKKI